MTILDAIVPVMCNGCGEEINIEPAYVYTSYSGKSGHYDTKDSSIEEALEDNDWIVDGQHHYCCEECYRENS